MQARVSGAVALDAIIDEQGNVTEIRALSGHALLSPAAIEAVKQWKYEPTILSGRPVAVQLIVNLTFALNN